MRYNEKNICSQERITMLDVALSTHIDTFQLELAFQTPEQQTIVVLGESGTGKSTLLRLLAGLLRPEQGHIILNATTYVDTKHHVYIPPQQRPFGFVFQDYVLFPHLTVFENIAFGLRAQRRSHHETRQRVEKVLEQVQMREFAQRRPTQLSGGQQQRIALARALVLQPQLLLLDEPLSALDVQTRREIRQQLRQILSTAGITTVMVTHNYLDGLLFGQQILVMDQGHIIQQGDQQALSRYPRSSYVAELVGVNFFHGRIHTIEKDTTCLVQLYNEQGQAAPLPDLVATLREQQGELDQRPEVHEPEKQEKIRTPGPHPGQEVFVVIDPRSITLHHQQPEGSARNLFHGHIQQLLHLETGSGGHDGRVRIYLQLAEFVTPLVTEITASSAQRMALQEGQHLYATCKASETSAYM
jgi:molybdate transport system ATP-binding protein